jgi:hypothetical protein
MTAALIAFANTGNPTTPDVKWPAWSAANEQLLEIGNDGPVARPINKARLDFMAAQTPQGRGAAPARGVPGQPRD